MPLEEAWRIAPQVAVALDYAHERGIVHRDLKPADIKVTPDGVVKLLDLVSPRHSAADRKPAARERDAPVQPFPSPPKSA
jgi:serine/threonine-protein kinase